MTGTELVLGKMRQGGQIHSRLHAVALYVRVHKKGRAIVRESGNHIIHDKRGIADPPAGLEPSALRIQRNPDTTGEGMAQSGKTFRLLERHSPDDQPRHTGIQPARSDFFAPDASPELHGNGQGLADAPHQFSIRRNAVERPVKIHKMEELRALVPAIAGPQPQDHRKKR